MIVLGIHFGHDASACIVRDGVIIYASAEERHTRVKHYGFIPISAIKNCLEVTKTKATDLDYVALSSEFVSPLIKDFLGTNNIINENSKKIDRRRLAHFGRVLLGLTQNDKIPENFKVLKLGKNTKVVAVEHHLAHAASTYYTSGFDHGKHLIFTSDGIGDNTSLAVWEGNRGEISKLTSYGSEASFGWFYGYVTEKLGWWIGNGEGKTMGLAPYGDYELGSPALDNLVPKFKNGELTQKFQLKPSTAFRIYDTIRWSFSENNRSIVEPLTKQGKNLAARAQWLLEGEMAEFIQHWSPSSYSQTDLAGGVFINMKLNQNLIQHNILGENTFIFPDPGDGGLSVGAALWVTKNYTNDKIESTKIEHPYWGKSYDNAEIKKILQERGLKYEYYDNVESEIANKLNANKIVGWFQGKMEFGPRALGNRSILVNPSSVEQKDKINSKVKFRDWWRPFCPSIIYENLDQYFIENFFAPFMIVGMNVKDEVKNEIPAVVHVDQTARPQTVSLSQNERFYSLIKEFEKLSQTPVLLNTSLNIKGDPIIESPRGALKTFFDTGMDTLVLGNYVVEK